MHDGDKAIQDGFDKSPCLSIISWVDLERGVKAKPQFSAKRRLALDAMLKFMIVLDFDAECVAAYRHIVERIEYSRRKVIDRTIAATALTHGLALATGNERDFIDIPDLRINAQPRD
jgi:predicted nucleic acid-binding protein